MKKTLLSLAIPLVLVYSSFAQHKTSGFIDIQDNSHGNIAMKLTNYGIVGADAAKQAGGTFWKRGTTNQYMYGGGMWFGAKKDVGNKPNQKLVLLSYNPNLGTSWMSPTVDPSCKNLHDSVQYARLYFSTDFTKNGVPTNTADSFGLYNWPIFKKDNQNSFGEFVANPILREASSGTPYFVSNEDVICAYNDHDLTRYDNGDSIRRIQGYPLGVSIVQRTYFFDKAPLQDVVMMRYEITHTGSDTLKQCWFAPVMDFDIGFDGGTLSAYNDNIKYYASDTTLGLVFGWTKTSTKDKGKGLGYAGFTFLETPSVDEFGNLTNNPTKELGLRTHRNWELSNDPQNDTERYDFISTGTKDGEASYGDKKMLVATGPFNVKPNETVVFSFALMFAATSSGDDATGTNDDAKNIIQLCRDTKDAYSQFRLNGKPLDADEPTPTHRNDPFTLYPNPASGICTVEYKVDTPSTVSIELFDVLSNGVSIIENGEKQIGTYRATVDTQSLSAGIYYCRIVIAGHSTLKKLVIIK
jgi:hypothetical protein